MKKAHSKPEYPRQAVCWQEGMLLLPQHFQWQDRQLMQYAFDLSRVRDPYRWGVGKLEFNMPALEQGVVELSSFSALFPDGAWVSLGSNSVIDSRYVLEHITDQADLYVGLQRSGGTLAEEGPSHQGEQMTTGFGRYIPSTVNTADIHDPVIPGEIDVLNYRLGLYLPNEPQLNNGHDLIRIARIRVSGTALQLDETYIPPLLTVTASRAMFTFVRNLTLWLEQRRWQLRLAPGADDGILRQILCRCLGQWSQWLSGDPVSPYQVFKEILGVAREVALLRAAGGAARLLDTEQDPKYDHRDISGSLARALQVLREVLENSSEKRIRELEFTPTDDNWYLELNEEISNQATRAQRLILLLDGSEKMSLDRMPSICKLASRSRLPELVTHALPGLPLSMASSGPGSGADCILEISASGDLWREIIETRNLALHVEDPPERLRARLLLVLGESGR